MPSAPLHVARHLSSPQANVGSIAQFQQSSNVLPRLLHTPTGLAILEIQGTINLPTPQSSATSAVPIGRVTFPLYKADDQSGSTDWMKTVHLYVGQHQRLSGEVKKLPRPIAILTKRRVNDKENEQRGLGDSLEEQGLEIVEIVEWKILFSSRPEPVGD